MLTEGLSVHRVSRPVIMPVSRHGFARVRDSGTGQSLRLPLLWLIFLALALDAPGENAGGYWDSPLAALGGLLTENLNKTLPVSALTFPLSALVLTFMIALCLPRLLASAHARRGRPLVAPPLLWSLAIALTGIAALVAFGAVTGGNIQMAKNQVQNFTLVLLAAGVSAATLTGARDYRLLGRVIVAAACTKAFIAIWVAQTILPAAVKAQDGHFATTHGDSLLFAGALVIIVARWVEERRIVRHRVALLVVPIIIAGMISNNRRLAWIELASALAMLCLIGPRWLRRALARWAMVAAVPALVYVAAGWNSTASLFAPVRMIRSVQDSDVDSSTLFRDIENYNLVYTVRSHPLLGKGFGHPFDQAVKNFDISFFKEYYFLPHNSILGLWAFGGLLGYSALSSVLVIAAYCAARSYRLGQSSDQRVAAVAALGMLVIYEIQCWGDIGFSDKRAIMLVGPALAIAGQLSVATGAWRPVKRSPRRV